MESIDINPVSIRLTVGALGTFTTGSDQLSYDGGTVRFRPFPRGSLGGYETTLQVALVTEDTLGHAGTNTWAFKSSLRR